MYRKYTIKELKDYARLGLATDITYMDGDEVYKLRVNTEGLSFGKYGMNGGLFRDVETGELYIITGRTSNLFKLA